MRKVEVVERRDWSKQTRFEADPVITPFGFDVSPVLGENPLELRIPQWGTYQVDRIKMTSWPGVFAGGDIVRGADLFVTAIKDDRDAPRGIDECLERLPMREETRALALAAK